MPSEQSKLLKAIGIIAFVVLLVVVVLWATPWLMVQAMLITAKDKLVDAGVPDQLATGLMWLLGVPFALAFFRAVNPLPGGKGPGWPKSRPVATGIVGTYVGCFYIALFLLGGPPAGSRYYCPVGCIQYFKKAGVCPKHLVPLKPLTAQALVSAKRNGCKGPQRIENLGPDGPFRDIETGAVLVYFGHDHRSRLVPYDGPGYDPVNGVELVAADPIAIAAYEAQLASKPVDGGGAGGDPAGGGRGGSGVGTGRGGDRSQPPVRRSLHPEWDGMSTGQLFNLATMQPDNAALHFYIGQRLEAEGDQAGALRSYEEARRANPNDVRALNAIDRLTKGQ
jgi:hypothetical protein